MNSDKLNKWLTLGANIGVLAGIVLVAYEINQSSVTTRAEMMSNYQERWIAIGMSWQDTGFAIAWAKAIESPEDLTVAEMIQVSGQLWAFLDQVSANQRLWQLGVLSEPMPRTEDVVAGQASLHFGNAFAQSWWIENRNALNSDLVAILDPVIENITDTHSIESFDRIRGRPRQ